MKVSAFLALLAAVLVIAPRPAPAGEPETTLRVEKADHDVDGTTTLPWLRANRDFLRARLDLLRQIYGTITDGDASLVDPRYLELQRMLDELRAHMDTARAGAGRIAGKEILDRVSEISWLEDELGRMEELLLAQEARLDWLEEDFTGRQRTTLIVLLRGVPDGAPPHRLVLTGDGDRAVRVELGDTLWSSLHGGSMAKVYHARVEPRELAWKIGFEGEGWTVREPFSITVAPERDRLTFLEIDMGGVSAGDPADVPVYRAWVR